MNDVDTFVAEQKSEAERWLTVLVSHMRKVHPDLPESLYYGMPAWRHGKYDFIAISCHAQHFTLHTLDFDYLEVLKKQYPKSRFGKGSLLVKYADAAMEQPLFLILDELAARMKSHI